MSTRKQLATFTVDGLELGIDVCCVREVVRSRPITEVPLAPVAVAGLINLRGEIVTAIDLRCRLSLRPFPADARPMNVIVHDGDAFVSLLADAVGDVVSVDASTFEPTPHTLGAGARRFLAGAYKLERGLLLVVDTEAVISATDVVPRREAPSRAGALGPEAGAEPRSS